MGWGVGTQGHTNFSRGSDKHVTCLVFGCGWGGVEGRAATYLNCALKTDGMLPKPLFKVEKGVQDVCFMTEAMLKIEEQFDN